MEFKKKNRIKSIGLHFSIQARKYRKSTYIAPKGTVKFNPFKILAEGV